MPDWMRIEQALFGYREGHNLMAASVPLAPQVRQFLATITDSSGPENAAGFEAAFTGLPVPETDFYALFRTWPAPEMPRPGCVWSHVILIGKANLAQIADLSLLKSLCVRPSLPLKISSYEAPISLDAVGAIEDTPAIFDRDRADFLLRALYEHPDVGVVVLDVQNASWELPLFNIWSQQWPRLRGVFAFSLGSLADRRLAGVAFDLQVAPLSSERLWRRTEAPTLVLNYSNLPAEPFTAPSTAWVNTALTDLQGASQNGFRQFLIDYGSDVGKPRGAYAKLAVAHENATNGRKADWTKLLRLIGGCFPSKTEAAQLKRTLTAVPKLLSSAEDLERAFTVATFLVSAPEAIAYDSDGFDFANLAPSLWKQKRDAITSLLSRLVRKEENCVASAFAAAIAKAVDSAALKFIADTHPELVPMMIGHCPALAFDVETWHLPGHVQSQIYEALSRLSLAQNEWAKVVGAMFIAATDVSVREAVGKAGSHAMQGAFRWLDHAIAEQILPSQFWREALAGSSAEVLGKSTALSPAELALCAWCVPSETVRHTLSASRADIQHLAQQPLESLPLPLRVPTAFVLATLGLRSKTEDGVRLLVKSFYPVHDALASARYSPESWSLLSPELPDLGRWRDWDRCKRLRRAVNDWLTRHLQTCNPLLQAADTPEHQELARRVSDGDDGASEFLD